MSSPSWGFERLLSRKLRARLVQLEAATHAHAQAEQIHAAVMENMAEGLYVVDRDGRLVLMNAAATRLLGWTEKDLVGRRMHDVVHHQRANGTPLPIEECELSSAYREGRAVHSHNDVFTHKDGSIVPVRCSAAPLTERDAAQGAVVVFHELSDEHAEREQARVKFRADAWTRAIRDALADDRLALYAQPIVPLEDGPPGEELLLRLIRRDGAVIAPGEFLPFAEKYGLVGELDRWVVTEAIRRAAGGRRVQLNLSANTVGDPQLLTLVAEQLRQTRATPSDVVFEITETALIHDIDAGAAFAHGLTDLGCELALDDFGTGFGSFTYLKRLPVSYLKIDIEFVRNLRSSNANQHLVRAIVNLAQGFGHETIAEGVEDEETLLMLREFGVDYAQGFHLGPPAPISRNRVPIAS
ncbi:MAG TPA: EAL domain-containing protein [Solirubrobacteraceae bacterium]|nr:EAL domain-containing protein [Solirubrobacteraceae bacterium]